MRAFGTVVLIAAIGRAALASESDVLLQAVSFAITGSDGSNVIAIDRARCVFKLGNDTFYLNNVYADRIGLRKKKNGLNEVWAEVDLHGKNKVVEHYSEPPKPTGISELDRALLAENPNYFSQKGQTSAGTDYTIKVVTRESDRLVKAWQYIYANGCKGLQSPF